MAINFPTSLDTLTNPTATDTLDSPDHATQHANVNDIVEALEAKVGINSSAVTSSHDFKLSGVTGSDKAASLTGTETLSSKTLTLPQINDTSSDHQYVFAVSELAADRTVTLPLLTGNDTFVFNAFAATLTNKTLTTPVINGTITGTTVFPIANGGTSGATATAGFDALAPTTTKGDVVVSDGTNNLRLAVGSNTQVLTADSGEDSGVKWASPGAATTPTKQDFTSSGTWTKPASLAYVVVELVGGGAGGGGANADGEAGGGGGGGGYSREVIDAGALGATETVTIGAGGAGGTSGGIGTAGGTTSFGSLLQATGGAGGSASVASSPVAGGAGGAGSGGDINSEGGDGGTGIGNVTPDFMIGGHGGSSHFGGGGFAGGATGGTELPSGAGNIYGGGGGGGAEDDTGGQAGGAGAAGYVTVTQYF